MTLNSHTGQQSATSAVLSYWESVELLTPPDPPDGTDLRMHKEVDWQHGQTGQAADRVQNIILLGIFDKEAAAASCLQIIGKQAEAGREPRKGSSSYLASLSVDNVGQVLPGSFCVTAYALCFEQLPDLGADTTRRAAELAEAFEARFHEFLKPGPATDGGKGGAGASPRRMDRQEMQAASTWLQKSLKQVPPGNLKPAVFQRRLWPGDEPDMLMEQSFFLSDLRLANAAVGTGMASRVLEEYLCASPREEARCRNADDIGEIRASLHPARWPLGKWPGRGGGPEALVMRQQMAVNEIMQEDACLVAVNGPPGTGKSTLLRDVVAAVITRRAQAMCRFANPSDAFSGPFEVPLEDGPARAWTLDPSLRGFGILVASSNNTAVENITRELPQLSSIAALHRQPDAMERLDLFRSVADRIAGKAGATWGLVSAALGNGKNRAAFTSAALAHAQVGRRSKLGDATERNRLFRTVGSIQRADVQSANPAAPLVYDGVSGGQALVLKIFRKGNDGAVAALDQAQEGDEELGLLLSREEFKGATSYRVLKVYSDPPDITDLLQHSPLDWDQARREFGKAVADAQELIDASAAVLELPGSIRETGATMQAAAGEAAQAVAARRAIELQDRQASEEAEGAERAVARLVSDRTALLATKPGLLQRMMRKHGGWELRWQDLEGRLASADAALAAAQARQAHTGRAMAALEADQEAAQARLVACRDGLTRMQAGLQAALAMFKAAPAWPDGNGLEGGGFELMAPGNTPELDLARERVFVAAIALHRAFLAGAASRATDNLALFRPMMSQPDKRAVGAAAGGDIWDSLFLAVPVVSSTFASVAAMSADSMATGHLGWLLVDEAGQAVPQAAVGALLRTRRALVVGDPLQIEPVSTVPAALTRMLLDHHGVPSSDFDPSHASVQTLADRVTALGALIGEGGQRVGCPLRVHRRCHEPMFSISNRVSYGGTMVLGKAPLDTSSWKGTVPDYGPGGHYSAWFDTPFEGGAEGHWIPAQGRVVLGMLLRMVAQHAEADSLVDGGGRPLRDRFLLPSGMPIAFVITPFRDISMGLASLVCQAFREFAARNPAITQDVVDDWARGPKAKGGARRGGYIGTLHTFQGREAPTVFLALGCTQQGRSAVSWAGKKPNLLNVAVTRAKDSFYVVGSHALWSGEAPFGSATSGTPKLGVHAVPEFVGTVTDLECLERIDSLDGHLDVLAKAFKAARTAIHISSPYLTRNAIEWDKAAVLDMVRGAVESGAAVHVYNDPAMTEGAARTASLQEAWALLEEAGAAMHRVDQVHSKVLCVDDREIIEGSFNWLSASRDTNWAKEESSFRYTGRSAPDLIAKALAQMAGAGSVLPEGDAAGKGSGSQGGPPQAAAGGPGPLRPQSFRRVPFKLPRPSIPRS